MRSKWKKMSKVLGYKVVVVGVRENYEESYIKALSRFNDTVEHTQHLCMLYRLWDGKEVARGGTDTKGQKWTAKMEG